jgi:proteasome assembly chaperone (PAC2) family protein
VVGVHAVTCVCTLQTDTMRAVSGEAPHQDEPIELDHVRFDGSPVESDSIVIAAFEGWNDAGDAATTAARTVIEQCDGRDFAAIEPEEFYDFTTVRPQVRLDFEGNRSIHWPETRLAVCPPTATRPALVVVVGVEPQLRWRTFCSQVVGVAQQLNASMLVTLGALLADVPHTRPTEVFGTTEDETIRERTSLPASSYEGPTGILGALNSISHQRSLPTASLWAAVPSYVPSAPSPKAAVSLIKSLSTLIEVPLETDELDIAATSYQEQVDELVAEDEDTAEYVRQLEESFDESPDATPIVTGPADADELVAEVERFLRDQD